MGREKVALSAGDGVYVCGALDVKPLWRSSNWPQTRMGVYSSVQSPNTRTAQSNGIIWRRVQEDERNLHLHVARGCGSHELTVCGSHCSVWKCVRHWEALYFSDTHTHSTVCFPLTMSILSRKSTEYLEHTQNYIFVSMNTDFFFFLLCSLFFFFCPLPIHRSILIADIDSGSVVLVTVHVIYLTTKYAHKPTANHPPAPPHHTFGCRQLWSIERRLTKKISSKFWFTRDGLAWDRTTNVYAKIRV